MLDNCMSVVGNLVVLAALAVIIKAFYDYLTSGRKHE